MLPSVGLTLVVYQVCHDVGRCVKNGALLRRSWSEKSLDSISGISYDLNER